VRFVVHVVEWQRRIGEHAALRIAMADDSTSLKCHCFALRTFQPGQSQVNAAATYFSGWAPSVKEACLPTSKARFGSRRGRTEGLDSRIQDLKSSARSLHNSTTTESMSPSSAANSTSNRPFSLEETPTQIPEGTPSAWTHDHFHRRAVAYNEETLAVD
jgi:hypothetical protein